MASFSLFDISLFLVILIGINKKLCNSFCPRTNLLEKSLIPKSLKMGSRWNNTWKDILSGGNPRWKVTDEEKHLQALSYFQKYVKGEPSNTSVFCPLAGDDPMAYLLFSKGYSVTCIDLVPEAVEEMKNQFGKDESESIWTKEEKDNTIIWSHVSGRATLMVGDALQSRSELVNSFDAVYDKDSFGALPISLRDGFCERIGEYVRKDGVVYIECKLKENHEEVKNEGPPFSLTGPDLMSYYGKVGFEYVEGLGEVYELDAFPGVKHTGHALKRQ